jgi:predicted nucleotidyltransferase
MRAGQAQPALMLSARTTLPHFSVSSATNLPKSAGDNAIGEPRLQLRIGEARIDLFVELLDSLEIPPTLLARADEVIE